MKIVVDCRVFTKRATGVATYAIDAIRAICKYIPDWHLTLVSPVPFHKSIVGLPLDKVDVIIEPMFGNAKVPNVAWFHLHFPKIVKRLNADLVWTPRPETPIFSVGKAKRLITVHDVVGKEFVKTMTWKVRLFALPFVDISIKKADLLWCNSHYTLSKLQEYYPVRKQINTVVGDSCSTRFHKLQLSDSEKSEIYKEYGITKGFILFVGTLEPRKNLGFLLKLMPEIYKRTGYKLLIVGASGWKNSNIAELVNQPTYDRNSIFFAKYVEFEKLLKIYNSATLYVSTALNEGFGMPQLEAMVCGCPVVSPHNSAMIEVVENRGCTISGWNEEDWIVTISNLLNSPEELEKMKNPDISEYDWEKIIMRVKQYVESQK